VEARPFPSLFLKTVDSTQGIRCPTVARATDGLRSPGPPPTACGRFRREASTCS
jgi:hypothetical protein